METLAYLHLELSYEDPTNTRYVFNPGGLRLGEWLQQHKLTKHTQIYWLSLLVSLSFFGMASEALAQRALRLGTEGSDVVEIQERLRELGYFSGPTTGYYDPITQDAVIRFQRASYLDDDGVVGPATRSALLGSPGFISDRPLSVPSLPPLGNSPPPPSIRDDFSTARFEQNRRTEISILRRGDRGSAVRDLQRRLSRRGFNPGPIDGVFGPQTERAVRQFQRAIGLFPDGVAGSRTLVTLGIDVDVPSKPYVVAVPLQDENTLFQVRQFVRGAFVAKLRRGEYVNAGEFDQREDAESLSYYLRGRELDARVVYVR